MSIRDLFYFLAGALAALAAGWVVRALWRRPADAASRPVRELLGTTFGALAVVGAALALYCWLGAPGSLALRGAAQPGAPHIPLPGKAPAGSLAEATARLAARLARDGGSAEEWKLLALSYQNLGRPDDARQASARAAALGSAGQSPVPGPSAAASAAASAPATPDPVLDAAGSALLARAETLRRARDYAGAIAIYARLAKHAQLSAQAYADYADAVASRNGGSLAGEPARLIEEALRRDPRQPKALWLRASLAHEQHREADALADWRLLATVLPADSPDQRIIAANIVEAQRLAGLGSNGDAPATAALAAPATSVMAASPTPAMSAPAVARISGVVDLASPLAASAPSDATLYIYAKSPGAPGPPLAVLRVRAAHWPVSFSLDDRNAMIPGRTLSGAERVQLEARISLSGNALPQAGDLVGSVADVDPRAGRAVHIAIDHRIS